METAFPETLQTAQEYLLECEAMALQLAMIYVRAFAEGGVMHQANEQVEAELYATGWGENKKAYVQGRVLFMLEQLKEEG